MTTGYLLLSSSQASCTGDKLVALLVVAGVKEFGGNVRAPVSVGSPV